MKVAGRSSEKEFLKVLVGERIDCALARLGSGAYVGNEVVDMFDDGFVTTETSCEGVFTGVEVFFD